MRLTNTIRQAFVAAVMNDVPSVDHDEIAQGAVRDYVQGLFREQFPGIDFETAKPWMETKYVYMPGTLMNVHVYSPWNIYAEIVKVAPSLKPRLEELAKGKHEQAAKLESLREKLTGIAAACSTTEKLAKALPEFAKYLPAEPTKSENLPALANVVTEFMQAGWPKERQPA